MDAVFRALADPSRRRLLDLLFEKDGRPLKDLQKHLDMTRFGVMAHLRVLEEAGLLTTRRSGREKLHFLNPIPIRLVHDRWVSRFAAPRVGALVDLKYELEENSVAARTEHVYVTYIKTTPERLWEAITKPEWTRRYYYGNAVASDWEVGSSYAYSNGEGALQIEGTVLEADRPKKLVMTFHGIWSEALAADASSQVTFEIVAEGNLCRLTMIHEVDPDSETRNVTKGGWPYILSALKTVLETGKTLE